MRPPQLQSLTPAAGRSIKGTPLLLQFVLSLAALIVGVSSIIAPSATVVVSLTLLSLVIALLFPSVWLVLVLPASFLTYRLGGPSGVTSVADGLLALGGLAAIPTAVNSANRDLQRLVSVVTCYLAALALLAAIAPSQAAIVEWLHRAGLLLGALLAGVAVARLGLLRLSAQVFIFVACSYALAAIVQASISGWEPAYPLGVTKNHAGGLFAVALITVVAVPRALPSRVPVWPVAAVLAGGLAAAQSRASTIGLVAGMMYVVVRRRTGLRSSLFYFLVAALVASASLVSLSLGQKVPTSVRLSSVNERERFLQTAYQDWRKNPIYGNGIRYYLDERRHDFPEPVTEESPEGAPPHPHNLVIEALSEAGLVGLVALVVLLAATLAILGRIRTEVAIAAGAVLVATAAMGLFDLFWLAGRTAVPFLLAGAATTRLQLSGRSG